MNTLLGITCLVQTSEKIEEMTSMDDILKAAHKYGMEHLDKKDFEDLSDVLDDAATYIKASIIYNLMKKNYTLKICLNGIYIEMTQLTYHLLILSYQWVRI